MRVDPELVRPAEAETLCADSQRAQAQLGWQPEVAFPELMRLMVDADLFHATRQRDFARFLEQTPHPLTQLDPEPAAVW